MRKLSLLVFIVFTLCGCEKKEHTVLTVNDVVSKMNDTAFIWYCLNLCDFNHDGCISMEEADKVTSIDIRGNNDIRTVNGIEYFTNLSSFYAESCQNLISVDLSKNSMIKTIEPDCFYRCKSLEKISLPKELVLIESFAFHDCGTPNLTIEIPESVTRIERNAFYACYGSLILTNYTGGGDKNGGSFSDSYFHNVTFGKKCKSIGCYAFTNCDKLENIVIDNYIYEVGTHAFEDCDAIDEIVFPDGLSFVGCHAFNNCGSLKNVYFKNKEIVVSGSWTWDHTDWHAFPSGCNIHVYYKLINKYADEKYERIWGEYYGQFVDFK